MLLAYVSGKYSDPSHYQMKRYIIKAEEVAVELWKFGFAVICPHTNTSFLDGIVPYDNFIKGDKLMVERSDLIVMVDNWKTSKGANIELKHAVKKKVVPFFWPDDISYLVVFGKCGCLPIGYRDFIETQYDKTQLRLKEVKDGC